MNFVLERISEPALEVLTVAEVKRHLGEFDDITDFDTDLEGLIKSAREWAENLTGRTLVDTTYRLTIAPDDFALALANGTSQAASGVWAARADGGIWLRRSPVLAVASINSIATDGELTELDPESYAVREASGKWPRLYLVAGTWSGPYAIEYRAGYADQTGSPQTGVDVVPYRFKAAMNLWVQAHYHQSDEKAIPMLVKAAENILRPERVELGMA